MVLNGRLIADWSVEDMNPDVTIYGILLVAIASVTPKKKTEGRKETTNI